MLAPLLYEIRVYQLASIFVLLFDLFGPCSSSWSVDGIENYALFFVWAVVFDSAPIHSGVDDVYTSFTNETIDVFIKCAFFSSSFNASRVRRCVTRTTLRMCYMFGRWLKTKQKTWRKKTNNADDVSYCNRVYCLALHVHTTINIQINFFEMLKSAINFTSSMCSDSNDGFRSLLFSSIQNIYKIGMICAKTEAKTI